MKVVMPVARYHNEAVEALLQTVGHQVSIIPVHQSDYAYWYLFSHLWKAGQPFVLVEHDIVIRPDTIDLLAACPALWCGFVYHEAPGEPVAGLGCTKITPDPRVDLGLVQRLVWQNVDSAVTGLMMGLGLTRHDHHPWLRHLNPTVAAYQDPRP